MSDIYELGMERNGDVVDVALLRWVGGKFTPSKRMIFSGEKFESYPWGKHQASWSIPVNALMEVEFSRLYKIGDFCGKVDSSDS